MKLRQDITARGTGTTKLILAAGSLVRLLAALLNNLNWNRRVDRVLDLVCLAAVLDNEGVQESRASDLELCVVSVLLNLHLLRVATGADVQKLLEVTEFLWHC
eukprot:TRINITY_DN830_c0_g1_i2.p1 TRINITY_DN830_c0_g1~~TRINITY_DN830_c0_g1_i2.p1  ORF type:complete len:103 (-),score=14.25 TRINITY_DN830_c0_g1_i2:60-368(-)